MDNKRTRIIIINSDERNTAILPNILLVDVEELSYEESVNIIELVTWYKKIGIVENFEEIKGNNFIKLHLLIKPDHFYNHFAGGNIEFPNYNIIGKVSEEMYIYLIRGWEGVAKLDKGGRFYRLWLDLRYNYKKYMNEAIIKGIIE